MKIYCDRPIVTSDTSIERYLKNKKGYIDLNKINGLGRKKGQSVKVKI